MSHLEDCSTALKKSDTERVFAYRGISPWKDSHLHEFNFCQTEDIILANLGVTGSLIGDILIYLFYLVHLLFR